MRSVRRNALLLLLLLHLHTAPGATNATASGEHGEHRQKLHNATRAVKQQMGGQYAAAVPTCNPGDDPLASLTVPIKHRLLGGGLALAGCVATIAIHRLHKARLRDGTAASAYRGLYVIISRLAPTLAVLYAAAAAMPDMDILLTLFAHMYHSVAMWAFLELMLLLTFQQMPSSNSSNRASRARARGSTDLAYLLDPRDYVEAVASSLRQQPPMPYWASPPLCCIFYLTPCCFLGQPGTATARLLKFCRHGLLAYLVGMPLVPFLSLLVKAQFERGKHALLLLGLVWCQGLLSLFALYALFITYRLTRVPLKDFRTTAKFATIKALLSIEIVQKAWLTNALGMVHGEYWHTVLMCLEMAPLGLALLAAFPARELPQPVPPSIADLGHWRSMDDLSAKGEREALSIVDGPAVLM